jgi:UDP-glucose 4-epimerase
VNILVTGGAGHLGSAMYPFMLEWGHSVTVLDSMVTGRYPSLFMQKPFKMIQADILDVDWDRATEGIDCIVHLAAITDAPSTVERRSETFAVNLGGTMKAVDAAQKRNIPIIFPSTTSVFGVSDGEVDETCQSLFPQSPYAESKLKSERYALQYDKSTVLRCGTVYGPSIGMRFHTFCNQALWNAATGQPIKVWRTAMDQVRPYLYLVDFISAVSHVINDDLYGLYCTVTENATPKTIIDIIKKYRPEVRVEMTDSVLMNLLSYSVSSKKLRDTGWIPAGTLEAGIEQTFKVLGGIHG